MMSKSRVSERVRSGRFPVKGLSANSALVAHKLSTEVLNDLADEIAALEAKNMELENTLEVIREWNLLGLPPESEEARRWRVALEEGGGDG